MIPKEIQDKIKAGVEKFYGTLNETYFQYSTYYKGAEYGYQLATDGREELEKENARLKTQNSAMKVHYEAGQKITEHSLKKANEAKSAVETVDSEREMNAILTNEITALQSQCTDKEKEIERLKELLSRLEDYFDDGADVQDGDSEDYIPRPNTEMCFLNEIRETLK